MKAVKENDPATLSFSDWEYVLYFRDASPANKQAAERVWQVIRESVEKNGTVKLKMPREGHLGYERHDRGSDYRREHTS